AKLIELLAELRQAEDVRAPELVAGGPVDESDGEAERVRLALEDLVQEEPGSVVPPLRDVRAAGGVLGDSVRHVEAEALDVLPRRNLRRGERRSLSLIRDGSGRVGVTNFVRSSLRVRANILRTGRAGLFLFGRTTSAAAAQPLPGRSEERRVGRP